MPRHEDHIQQPGGAVAERQESAAPEAPKADAPTQMASEMGNQAFSNTVARSPETADVKPGENAPGENEAPEAETQDVKPDEGAAAAEPQAAGPAAGESETGETEGAEN